MVREPVEDRDVVVFIRVPFCAKEHKGDAFGAVRAGKQAREDYLDALRREIEASADLFEGRRVRSVYVGGGIAAAADPDKLSRMLIELKRRVETVRGMELTVRFSPQTLTVPSMSAFNACSFNRVALEVLSTKDDCLKALGSPHSVAEVTTAIDCLNAFCAPNVDCELLYGIPGQTPRTLRNSAVICRGGRGMTHVTLRRFEEPAASATAGDAEDDAVVGGTADAASGVPTEEGLRGQFEAAAGELARNGYRHYAAGRFAREGFQSDYVLSEALGVDRIGFGLGAQSFLGSTSYRNTCDFNEYLAHSGDFTRIVRDVAEWDGRDLARRYVGGRLGLDTGVSLAELEGAHPAEASSFAGLWGRLESKGLAVEKSGAIVPTEEGMRRHDEVEQLVWA